jgi:UDP-N-acetylglucosamine 2-epimerase (non-hydrolysing)
MVLVPPMEYDSFLAMMQSSDLVLSDSGGVQEEAPVLGVPLLVMRESTERPEGIEAGCVRLCGTDPARVERELLRVLDEPELAARMAAAPSPYGDGAAATRIVDRIATDLGVARRPRRARTRVDAPEPSPQPTWPTTSPITPGALR